MNHPERMPAPAKQSMAQQARTAFNHHRYDKEGSKSNRRNQINRACAVCDWVQRHCQIHRLEQMGGRQIIKFWKAHQNLAVSTRYDYWLALCKLWEFTGKAGKPPEPKKIMQA